MEDRIEEAVLDDLPELKRRFIDYYADLKAVGMPYDLCEDALDGVIGARISSKMSLVLVVRRGDAIVAFLMMSILRLSREFSVCGQKFYGRVHECYVAPEARGHDYAHVLHQHGEQWLVDHNVPYMETQTLMDNKRIFHIVETHMKYHPLGTLWNQTLPR